MEHLGVFEQSSNCFFFIFHWLPNWCLVALPALAPNCRELDRVWGWPDAIFDGLTLGHSKVSRQHGLLSCPITLEFTCNSWKPDDDFACSWTTAIQTEELATLCTDMEMDSVKTEIYRSMFPRSKQNIHIPVEESKHFSLTATYYL